MSKKIVINIGRRCAWRLCKLKRRDRLKIRFGTGPQSFVEGKNLMARLTNEEFVDVSIAPMTAGGKPVAVDGAAVWVSSDPAVFTVVASADLTAVVTAVAAGVAQLTVEVDADLDVGETRTLQGSAAVEVVLAEAQTLEINFGTPQVTPLP